MAEVVAKANPASFAPGAAPPNGAIAINTPNGGGATTVNANVDPSKTANAIKASSAPFQIQPIQGRHRWFKLLVYGVAGTGKTELVASAVDVPDMRDVLMLDAEGGDITIEETPRITNKDKIFRIPVKDFATVQAVYDYLKIHCKFRDEGNDAALRNLQSALMGIPPADIETPLKFRTVCIDSVSEIDAYSMYTVLGHTDEKIITGEIDTAGWPEFRKHLEKMKKMIRSFRDLPMNLLMTSACRWSQDEMKMFHYQPAITGQVCPAVEGAADMVGFLKIEKSYPNPSNPQQMIEDPRRMSIQPSSTGIKFDAKNRRASFRGSYFDNPNMAMIMQGIGLAK